MTDTTLRDRLSAAGQRRGVAEADRDHALADIAILARRAHAAGMPVTTIARLAGVSRPTIYRAIGQESDE